jgi:hypothetical protein
LLEIAAGCNVIGFLDYFEACIAHLRVPIVHRRELPGR